LEIETRPQPRKTQFEISPIQIANGRVLRITHEVPTTEKAQIVSLEVAEAAGATPVEMKVRLPNGTAFNLLGSGDAASIGARYQKEIAAGNSYAGNVFFQPGAAGTLFGLANRLTGRQVQPGVIEAEVLGCKVSAPLNHGLGPGQKPHHLHGFAFDKTTKISEFEDHQGIHLRAEFSDHFYHPYWTGNARLTTTHSLQNGSYTFQMQVKNAGSTPVPMGAGSHPYFRAPSGDFSAVKLWIPGRQLVEIDDYTNVLPTGRILDIEPGSSMDFNQPGGRYLSGRYLDNLWMDLELDDEGYAFVEFIDEKAKLRMRMTALTKNIIGIQVYAPKPDQGVFAALELVTNLPDPREELWRGTPTGMKLLEPGDGFGYGYKIESLPWGVESQ
jgi:galactose mutarotase-like enzyme